MTYREKLQKEHPEKVNEKFIGGCNGCPSGAGYGPENIINYGCIPNEAKCTACWNKVIPGTEEKEYENLSRDELIVLIKHLEGKIETRKDAIIEKQEKEIKVLKADNAAADIMIEERDQKIQKLEGACRSYNDEVNRLNKLLNKRDDELKARIIENNHLKDKIDSLNVDRDNLCFECQHRDNKIMALDREITILKDTVKDRELKLAVYRSQAMQTYGTCCCKPDVIAEKDKEIERLKKSLEFEISHKDYWYNECHRLSKKVIEFENSNQELKDALAKEKSEHAKHHSLFGKYFAD